MAPIKFEEQIKDKLEKRSLSPSSDSWSKLANRLEAEEKPTKNPWFWWLGMAAAIVIMFTVSYQFFGSGESESGLPILVEEQNEEKKNSTLNKIETIELANEAEPKVEIPQEQKTTEEPEIIEYKSTIQTNKKERIQLASNAVEEEKMNEKIEAKKQSVLNEDELLMRRAVASALEDLKSENTGVTDREIDSLLKLASQELLMDKQLKESAQSVNAEALLQSVEDEMGQSFRSRVFDALKTSFETVKTAVAERNN
ncbi:hypothetical protein [Winogradskyella ursingii]|uniref:hypothetical protein n=1 Tax=Winogradskyella ursingii TaxID=2686079 RepID=UPI0015CC12FE|nr:hypothetical protein [Winogradskyella ursingii]